MQTSQGPCRPRSSTLEEHISTTFGIIDDTSETSPSPMSPSPEPSFAVIPYLAKFQQRFSSLFPTGPTSRESGSPMEVITEPSSQETETTLQSLSQSPQSSRSSSPSVYYSAEEGALTPPPPSPPPVAMSTSKELPPPIQAPSNSAVTLVNEEENTWPAKLDELQWDIPSHVDYPRLDALLTHITLARTPDYVALHQLAKIKPPNHFTCLCQHLCMEGAAQYLSGRIQTVDFSTQDLEELFWDLEWHLSSKTVKNDFYEACGHPPPHPPMQEECCKVFRKLHEEWTRRATRYGQGSTNKFFRRCNELSALYLLIFHQDKYTEVDEWICKTQANVPNPLNTI